MSVVNWPVLAGKQVEVHYTKLKVKGADYEFIIFTSSGSDVKDAALIGESLKCVPINPELGVYGTRAFTQILPPGGPSRSRLDLGGLVKALRESGVEVVADKRELLSCYIDVPSYIASKLDQPRLSEPEADKPTITTQSSLLSSGEDVNELPVDQAIIESAQLTEEGSESVVQDDLNQALYSLVERMGKQTDYINQRKVDSLQLSTDYTYSMDPAFFAIMRAAGVVPETIPALAEELFAQQFVLPTIKSDSGHRLMGDNSPSIYYGGGNKVISATDFNQAVERSKVESKPILLTQAVDTYNYAFTNFAKAAPQIKKIRAISFSFENPSVAAAIGTMVEKPSKTVKAFNDDRKALRDRLRLSPEYANEVGDIQILKIPAEVTTSRAFFKHVLKNLGYVNEAVFESMQDIDLSAPYTILTGEVETVDGKRKTAGYSPSLRDARLVGPDGEVTSRSVEVYLTSSAPAVGNAFSLSVDVKQPKTVEEVCAFFSIPVNAFGTQRYYELLGKFDKELKLSIVNELIDTLPIDLAEYATLSDNDLSKIVRSFTRAETDYSTFSNSYFKGRASHTLGLGSPAAFITAAYMVQHNANENVSNNPQALIFDKWMDRVIETKTGKVEQAGGAAQPDSSDEAGDKNNYVVRMYNDNDVMRLASDIDLITQPLSDTEQGLVVYTVEVDADGLMKGRGEDLLNSLKVQHDIKAAFLTGSGETKDLVIHLRGKNYMNVLNGDISAVSSVSSVSDINGKEDLSAVKLYVAEGPKETMRINAYVNKTEEAFPLDRDLFVKFIQEQFADDINNQVAYVPRSRYGVQVTTYMVPTNIAMAINEAFNNLEAKVGDIGEYVRTQLGFSVEQMDLFDPGQVDTIALLMNNHDEKMASIIGNSTGTGKTRVLVAMALHAVRQNRTVDLVSKTRTLLESFVSEAHALGVWDAFTPLVLSYSDKETVIYKPNGQEVTYTDHKGIERDQKEQYSLFVKTFQKSRDSIADFFRGANDSQKPNIIMHTYTLGNRFPAFIPEKNRNDPATADYSRYERSLKRDKVRTHSELIAILGRPLTTIADESHEQTGELSNTLKNKERSIGMLKSLGVDVVDIFASATWASKANKMGPYRNVFGDRVDPNVMTKMVQTIGLPAQESIVETVTRMGQYIRLELPKKGVVYDTRVDFVNEQFYTRMNDQAAEVHLMMRKAKDVVKDSLYNYRLNLLEKYRGRTLFYTDGNGNVTTEIIGGSEERLSGGIGHLNFSSTATLFNRVFSIAQKIETRFISDNIRAEIQEGRVALIAAELTGGTHVKRLMQKYGMPTFTNQEIEAGAFEAWLNEQLAGASENDDAYLDLQFGGMPNTTSLLRRLFEDSLAIDIVQEIQEAGKSEKTLRSIRQDYTDWIPVLVQDGLLSSADASTFNNYVSAIRTTIRQLQPLPFSPFDQLREQLPDLRFGEFSGRDINLVKTPAGYYAPAPRVQLDWNQGKGAIESFQKGQLDCIAGSKSLFTGYNLNSTKDDPRPRTTVNIEPVMAAIDSEQLKGRTNRIGVVGDVRMLGVSTTDIIDVIYTAKARKNGQSLNSLTGANAYSEVGSDTIELISTVGAKAIENVFSTSPELFNLLDIEFEQLITEGKKAFTQETAVITVLNQMVMLDTATKKQIVEQIEKEYRQILNEMKMDGLDPFKDRVLNIDAEIVSESKIRDGVLGNPFKGDVYAVEMEGQALVGQAIKPSTISREIAYVKQRAAERGFDTLQPHRDFTKVTLDDYFLQYSRMYEDMHSTISASLDANGNSTDPKLARLVKRMGVIESLAAFLKDVQVGSIVETASGQGVLTSLSNTSMGAADLVDGFSRLRNGDFTDHLSWVVTVVYPGDKEERSLSFDAWLRQGILVTPEVFEKEHPIYKQFKLASAEKHGYKFMRVVGLRGPMFRVTETAMDVAKVHGQLIIGEPVSIRLKDGSMERIWSMPKSVTYVDLITMPTRLAHENQARLMSFVQNHVLSQRFATTFASVVPSYERPLSRAKDVFIEINPGNSCRLFVPGVRTVAYGGGVVKDLKLHTLGSLQNLMSNPFSRTDKKSNAMYANFDILNLPQVIKALDLLDIPMFMSRDLTAIFRSDKFVAEDNANDQVDTAMDDLMSEMEVILNSGSKTVKGQTKNKKQEVELDVSDSEVAVTEEPEQHKEPANIQPDEKPGNHHELDDELMDFLDQMTR